MQHIWRSGLGWEERIPPSMQWERWIKLLQQLDYIEIRQCNFTGNSPEDFHAVELHIFVDASEEVFAAVAYFRIVERSRVQCSLVSAKTKAAPSKLLSIPRLELSAAVLSPRLSKSVAENHTIPIGRLVFWGNSCTFLFWSTSGGGYQPARTWRTKQQSVAKAPTPPPTGAGSKLRHSCTHLDFWAQQAPKETWKNFSQFIFTVT